jgi:signal transduction histidine kinase
VNEVKSELSETSQADAASTLAEINNLIDGEIDSIRDLSHDIIPIDVEEEGVSHAFKLLVRRSQEIHQINCTLETNGVLDKITNRELSTNLYHITQEAIKNAAIHGEADRVLVIATEKEGQLHLQIKDNGSGFPPGETNIQGMGLRIIDHRVDLLGGSFAIERLPDTDKFTTCIECIFPEETLSK